MTGERMTKAILADGETGWVQMISYGLFGLTAVGRVANIPYSGPANFHDVVKLRYAGGIYKVVRVLAKWYDKKTTVTYDHVDQFHPLERELRAQGCEVEGVIEPGGGVGDSPGIMMVAHYNQTDPPQVAEGMGIRQRRIG